jgi:HlyD family secretion protein
MSRSAPKRSIQLHAYAGAAVAVTLVAGAGGWAATTELSGAVVAPGTLVVESNVKKVQHPVGGVVGELNVRNGDRVVAGQIVMRLDETQTRANLAIVAKTLDELLARNARLIAEKDGAEALSFPEALLARRDRPDAAAAIAGEERLFQLRRDARLGQKSQLSERVTQLEEEVRGYREQVVAKEKEIALIEEELKGIQELWEKNLVSFNRLTSLQREAARLGGERGQLLASVAQAGGKTAEVRLQIIQVDQDMRSEVARELSDVRTRITEFSERKVAAEDMLRRIDIRAPQDGVVHQLAVHTVGGVIGPGEPVMMVVPTADALKVEARVSPADIDQIRPDQPAVLRMSAFNQTTTPEINGAVSSISADLMTEERTGVSYYNVRIAISPAELLRLGSLKLVPGMPADAFIQTSPRTALSYFLKPLSDQMSRAFREE